MTTRGRPPVLDAVKKEKILEALGQGFSVQFAARRVGCDEGTVRYAAKRDREFAAEMDQRQYDAEFDMVKNIRQASATPQYWRAAAWDLERMHPDRYAPRGRHMISPEQVVHLGKQFIAAIERNVPEEIRAPLLQDIRRLLGEMLTEGATRVLEDRADYVPEDCLPPYGDDDDAPMPGPLADAPASGPNLGEGVTLQEGAGSQESGVTRQDDSASGPGEAVSGSPAVVGEQPGAPAAAEEVGPAEAEGGRETGVRRQGPGVGRRESAAPPSADMVRHTECADYVEIPDAAPPAGKEPGAPPYAEKYAGRKGHGRLKTGDRAPAGLAPPGAEEMPGGPVPAQSAVSSPGAPPNAEKNHGSQAAQGRCAT
jgi:hypothetical protein